MPLTDVKIRNSKPKERHYKLFDGGGLFLLIAPQGGKLWRQKYRHDGKEKLLALGAYPEVNLAEARRRRESARAQLASGIDPGALRKAQKQADTAGAETFEVIAREWHDKFRDGWSQSHAHVTITRLERDVFPWIGGRAIASLKPSDVLAVLRRIESRGAAETARRLKIVCGQVCRYAVATGRAERDPTPDLKGALKPPITKHMAALTDPKQFAALLRAIDGYQGSFIVKAALRLAPLVFVRPGELRQAEWAEINFDGAEWNIPVERMKLPRATKAERKGQAHLVPLARQALEILNDLHPLTGSGKYLFPSHRTTHRPMSDNAILSALRRMGYSSDEMSGHGFRAIARTLLDEVLQVRPDFIEHQLAHAVRDPNGRAYNRTAHLAERKVMMSKWADYLDGLKAGAVVIPFKKAEE